MLFSFGLCACDGNRVWEPILSSHPAFLAYTSFKARIPLHTGEWFERLYGTCCRLILFKAQKDTGTGSVPYEKRRIAEIVGFEIHFPEFIPGYPEAVSDSMGLDECQTNVKPRAADSTSNTIKCFFRNAYLCNC